jgi:hypothetical protein
VWYLHLKQHQSIFFAIPPPPLLPFGAARRAHCSPFPILSSPRPSSNPPTHLNTPLRPHRRESVQDHPTAPSPYLHSAPLYLDFLPLHPLTSCQKSFPLLTQPNCSPPSLTVPPSGRPPPTAHTSTASFRWSSYRLLWTPGTNSKPQSVVDIKSRPVAARGRCP